MENLDKTSLFKKWLEKKGYQWGIDEERSYQSLSEARKQKLRREYEKTIFREALKNRFEVE